jgi:hypothetical protein
MVRLVEGAKWTYGWVVVGPGGEIAIPPPAWRAFGFRAGDTAIFTSTALFHVSYYPLFVVLLLPVIRRSFGLVVGLVGTAALFALYHLVSFYYFPAGLTLRLQLLLFASFLASMLLYLWTENLILVALIHTIGGSVGLVVNGTLFNQVDELLVVTAVIMAGLFSYMIVYEIRHRGRPYRAEWWLQAEIDAGAPRT